MLLADVLTMGVFFEVGEFSPQYGRARKPGYRIARRHPSPSLRCKDVITK